jgi:hypothetical protein
MRSKQDPNIFMRIDALNLAYAVIVLLLMLISSQINNGILLFITSVMFYGLLALLVIEIPIYFVKNLRETLAIKNRRHKIITIVIELIFLISILIIFTYKFILHR